METKNSVVFLKGKKVNLRPVSEVDLPDVTRWINDPEVRLFLNNTMPQTLEDEKSWLQGLSKGKPNNVTLIMETPEGRAIGVMGLRKINWIDGVGTTGSFIGEKDLWGKGIGTEAKILLLDYAFNTLNLRKICSGAWDFNERSIKYSLRCGYKEEARLKAHKFCAGEYHDEVLLAVFREDFTPVWEKYKENK